MAACTETCKRGAWLSLGLIHLYIALLVYASWHQTDLGYLSFYSLDEYVFHGSLLRMHDGFAELNLRKIFGYSFVNYGSFFWFLNYFSSAYCLSQQAIECSVIIPRLVTISFTYGTLLVCHRLLGSQVSSPLRLATMALVMAMPALWINGLWFHPEMVMCFFLLLSLVYFLRCDGLRMDRNFWMSTFFLACAAGLGKLQALTFFLIHCAYVATVFASRPSIRHAREALLTGILATVLIAVVFVMSNPFLLHPEGREHFLALLHANLQSNATNHGAGYLPSLTDKFEKVIHVNYLHAGILAAGLGVQMLAVMKARTHIPRVVLGSLVVANAANFFYILAFVNKDWQSYYLCSVLISLLLTAICLEGLIQRRALPVFFICVVFALVSHFEQYPAMIQLDYSVDKHAAPSLKVDEHAQDATFIADTLKGKIHPDTVVLSSPYTAIDFQALGLTYQNVRLVMGSLEESKLSRSTKYEKTDPALKVDFLVYNKDGASVADNDTVLRPLRSGQWGGRTLAENSRLLIQQF